LNLIFCAFVALYFVVLQHLGAPLITTILEQVNLTLKSGGILVVTEPLWSDRHIDLGLADETENARVHDAAMETVKATIRVIQKNVIV
jgi:hypothetical protein